MRDLSMMTWKEIKEIDKGKSIVFVVMAPITGALWHNCGSVFVVINAALLLRYKDQ